MAFIGRTFVPSDSIWNALNNTLATRVKLPYSVMCFRGKLCCRLLPGRQRLAILAALIGDDAALKPSRNALIIRNSTSSCVGRILSRRFGNADFILPVIFERSAGCVWSGDFSTESLVPRSASDGAATSPARSVGCVESADVISDCRILRTISEVAVTCAAHLVPSNAR